jgi:hypothetical protein
MLEFYGAARNLNQKYKKLVYEENYKNEINNESVILNKKFGSS